MFISISDLILKAGILFTSFYIFINAINEHGKTKIQVAKYTATKKQNAAIVAWCIIWSFLFAPYPTFLPLPLFRPIMALSTIAFIFVLTKAKTETIVSAYLLSLGISYILFYISNIVVGFPFMLYII